MTDAERVYIEVKDLDQLGHPIVDVIWRVPRYHAGRMRVRYKGRYYRLYGGPITKIQRFINVSNPLKRK